MNADFVVLADVGAGWESLLYAVILLLVGLALVIAEIFIVSFGLLSIAALASLAGSAYFAFRIGNVAGWLFIIISVAAVVGLVNWGARRIRTSSMVPQGAVTGNAGYRHVAERIGVEVGSVGVMVTPAHPSGRARFEGGECDVQARDRALERGAGVVVKRIDGPIIFVAPTAAETVTQRQQ